MKMSYRYKNGLLLLGSLLLLFLSNALAFQKTIAARESCQHLAAQLNLKEQAPERILKLKQKLAYYEQGLQQKPEDLLKRTSKACQQFDLRLQHFPKQQRKIEGEQLVLLNQIRVEGGFLNSLRLAEDLEQYGQLVALSFQKVKEKKSKRNQLVTDIYIQNIQKNAK